HFLRVEYGTFQLSGQSEVARPLPQLGAFAWRFVSELAYAPALLAVWGFVRARGGPELWALRASFVFSGPLFMALLNIPPDGAGQLFIPRFYMLPLWQGALWAGLGFSLLPLPGWKPRQWGIAAALTAVLLLLRALPDVQEEHRPTVAYWVKNTLQSLPPNAI